MTIRTKDGEFTDRVDYPKGEPENPLTDSEFKTRYDGLMEYAGIDSVVSEIVFNTVSQNGALVKTLMEKL